MDIVIWAGLLVKLVVIAAILLAGYLVNMIIIIPYFVRSKYRRYPNVSMSPRPQMFKGDLVDLTANVNNNVYRYWHYVEEALKETKPDIYVKFIGSTPMYLIFSVKALAQFKKLVPSEIDRDSVFLDKMIGKIFYGSYGSALSNQNWKDRRDTSMRTLGINFASNYIGDLVSIIDRNLSTWKVGDHIDFTDAFSCIEFQFTAHLLFGLDFVLEDSRFNYLTADGQFENVNMQQILRKLAIDSFGCLYDLKGAVFPFLNDYNLCEPFTTVMKNVKELERGLKDFLSKTTDKTSYYSKVKAMDMFTEKELIADLLILLFAGVDTTAHAVVSNLYFASKNPECANKCRESYEQNGITKNGVLQKEMLIIEKLDECEYSEYFIKESFRLDHTAPETVAYRTLENVEICGVPIRKDNLVSISLTGTHYDPKLWLDPLEFVPERFDPESKYFKAPSTGKARDPLAYTPFSTGLRACPGQTMARLVQRVALPYFLSTLDYEVDKDLLENDKALFNNTSQYLLKFTVKAIKK